jgi:hypothetical protein
MICFDICFVPGKDDVTQMNFISLSKKFKLRMYVWHKYCYYYVIIPQAAVLVATKGTVPAVIRGLRNTYLK